MGFLWECSSQHIYYIGTVSFSDHVFPRKETIMEMSGAGRYFEKGGVQGVTQITPCSWPLHLPRHPAGPGTIHLKRCVWVSTFPASFQWHQFDSVFTLELKSNVSQVSREEGRCLILSLDLTFSPHFLYSDIFFSLNLDYFILFFYLNFLLLWHFCLMKA